MIAAPAAIAAAPAPGVRIDLGDRLEAFLERAFRGHGGRLSRRLLPAPSFDSASAADTSTSVFTWLEAPCWLASSLGLDATPDARQQIDDLRWLQYCIYAVFRIQDDLIDGDTDDRSLAVATNPLLVEAARVAARHFDGDSPFWTCFRESLDATARAILTLESLQRAPERSGDAELALYAELSACLGVATAGVAIAAGRADAWHEQLAPALDGFAIASQIVDDLRDLREDLADGRVNHAAWFLSHPILGGSAEATEAVIASNLATTDRLDRLLARAGEAMDRGLAQLEAELCPQLHDALTEYRIGLPAFGARVQSSTRVVLSGSTQNR